MTVIERLQATGIRRIQAGRHGFRYRRTGGALPSKDELSRIRSLVIPPAWTDVWISASSSSTVQAIGKDRAGRWQYLYSEKQTRLREKAKLDRLLAFLQALPSLRTRVARDLRGEGLARERVLATMVRLLLRGFLRPGSEVYMRENGTYGLSTLRPRHVRVQGRLITLTYVGKGRKLQVRRIEDAAAARVVKLLLKEAAPSVFGYRDAVGQWVKVGRRQVNGYLREITGARFTAKDFRTWAGTLFGACALARQGFPEPASAAALKRSVGAAMRETSQILGNTPAVCRASYVSPTVLSSFEKGRILPEAMSIEELLRASPRALSVVERKLFLLIRSAAQPTPAAARALAA